MNIGIDCKLCRYELTCTASGSNPAKCHDFISSAMYGKLGKRIDTDSDGGTRERNDYRAVWIAESGYTIHGDFTSRSQAIVQVGFLKHHRTAWLEDKNGRKVSDE